ncbi:hypothetical protein [Actinotalea sp. K2]|uniref:hypothetical protein n=1 Tax=Actinotalea sp. K2 TaxID=2939438 RepID=UPI0020182457|nr:hypothetical protein [Actinotalea sp. K2]MCL3859461.1 hypothetical protein [Actinotalea sp. K2]
MWTRDLTSRQKAAALLATMLLLAAVVGVGLLLQEHGPGNMGTGFLQGAAVGLAAATVMLWRSARTPQRATTFERAFTLTGDERDDRVLTRALAVLGLAALPLTGAAAIAIGLGADVPMLLFFLLVAQLAVGATAFAVIARRS